MFNRKKHKEEKDKIIIDPEKIKENNEKIQNNDEELSSLDNLDIFDLEKIEEENDKIECDQTNFSQNKETNIDSEDHIDKERKINNFDMQDVINYYGEDFFGKITPLIADIDVTDINCNGRAVWATHVKKGTYRTDIDFNEEDIKQLAYRISNTENAQFNKSNAILQADLHDLRFQFTHESFSVSGTAVSIRKTPIVNRIKQSGIDENKKINYLSKEANEFLKKCIKHRCNVVVCGLTGSGKTELVKYLMGFVRDSERIITIEDTLELHLPQLYPNKDIVELKVNEFVDYDMAIKSCMRMLPVWVDLSEARGKEIKELIKCISTGAKICTTLHTDTCHQIASRMLNMFEENELSNDRIETMIYDYLDIGIHVRVEREGQTVRYVDEIVYFELTDDGRKICHDIYTVRKDEAGNYVIKMNELPDQLKEKFLR